MPQTRKKHQRQTPGFRRQALIDATLNLLAEGGPEVATVRLIAKKAGVTQGLIRHYFSTKDDLIAAAYEQHMTQMTEATSAVLEQPFRSHSARLAGFVTAALTPPVVDLRNVGLWAGFLHMTQTDSRMQRVHARTYRAFRDRLERLIVVALKAADLPHDPQMSRRFAIACNGVIDGLWLEGSALPDGFERDELSEIGLQSVGAIIGLNLNKTGI
jgi:AcrR family transcriptional regulator